MKHIISIFIILSVSMLNVKAQSSYNMQRALECINNDDLKSSEEYIRKELKENQKSVHALDLLGHILTQKQDFGEALNTLNKAVERAGKKDKEYLQMAYYHRAAVHTMLKDTLAAIQDYKNALELDPSDRRSMTELADLYFEQKDFTSADNIYKKMISDNEGDPYPYYGLARNAYTSEDFETAESTIYKASLIDTDKERIHVMKMRLYILQERYKEALEHCIGTMTVNQDNNEAYHTLMAISDTIKEESINRIIKESFLHSEEPHWDFLLSHLYIRHNAYRNAIEHLKSLSDNNSEYKSIALYWTAFCYDKLDLQENVIKTMNQAIAITQDDPTLFMMRADAKFYIQDLDGAESDYRKMMELDKEYGYYGFYRIGWIQEMKGNYKDALKCYDMGIALNDSYAYTYMMKGNLLKDFLKDDIGAAQALKKCISLDNGIGEGTCKQYAYLALGDTIKAKAVNDSILNTIQDPGCYYDAACLYSRMGESQKAVTYLKTAFEKGFRRISHVKNDNDLDNLRNNPEYKTLIELYEKKYESNRTDEYTPVLYDRTVEVPLRSNGEGSYYITCKANGFPMEFLLDTGCSDISISSTESNYMKKHGIIKDSDYLGEIRYQNASGDIKTARQINIKSFKIGNLSFSNVKASIVDNANAPLLLGQNILSKFGKLEIDHKKTILKIFTSNERQQ